MKRYVLKDFKKETKKHFGCDVPVEKRLTNMLFAGGCLVCIVCVIGAAIVGMPIEAILICLSLAIYIGLMFYISNKVENPELFNQLALMIINFVFFPAIFLTTGGVYGGIISYFIFGIIFSFLLFKGFVCFMVVLSEIIFYSTLIYLSFKWPQIVLDINSRSYTYFLSATTVVIVALATGLLVRLLTTQYRREKRKIDKAVKELEELSTKDPLTGVYNRRYMLDFLQTNINRAYNYGAQLSVVMFDIDKFKSLNDDFGHLVGDEILLNLCDLVGAQIRTSDILSRYGGEEFVAVFPNTSADVAYKRAEEIRKIVQDASLSDAVNRPITISGGVAEYVKGMTVEEIIGAADKNLYVAKNTGRNKICVGNDETWE